MSKTGIFISLFIKSIIAIAFISLIALIFNVLSPTGIPTITPFRTITVGDVSVKIPLFQNREQDSGNNAQVRYHAPDEIDLATAYSYYDNCSAIFIDTREFKEYCKGHIARAVSIPLGTLDFSREILPGLPRAQTIITYCDGEECSQSIDMAVTLSEVGFSDVYFFFGGWSEWRQAGYPVNTGDKP